VRSSSIETALVHALVAAGWERSYDRPPRVEPARGRLIRGLPNGWAAVLDLDVDGPEDGEEAERHETVSVRGGLTLPGAERLAAALGLPIPSDLALEMPASPGDVGTIARGVRVTGEHDGRRVVEAVLRFADDIVLPWASRHASADGWIAAQHEMRDDVPVVFHGEYAPAVLVASNRPDDALEHLRTARRHPDFAAADLPAEFAGKLRAFIDGGTGVPDPVHGLFPYANYAPAGYDVEARHDDRHAAFLGVRRHELEAEPAGVRWRYVGGAGLKVLRAVQDLRGSTLDHDPLEVRWRSVPYDAASEAALEQAFARTGARVAYEVMIVVSVEPTGDGGVDVRLDGTSFGRVGADALPEDVNAWPEGPTPARLSRKPRRPRYLLELRLLADIGP
jgi:hypothetical protein